ncbi:MAG: GtrA family protein [Dokdonella sp.]
MSSLNQHVTALTRNVIVRFLLGGASTTAFSYAVYLLLLLWLPYLVAYSVAFVAGVAWSYFANTLFVFRRRPTITRALAFPIVYLAQYLAGSLLLVVLIDYARVPETFAPLVVVVLTLPLTYVLSRWVITARHES